MLVSLNNNTSFASKSLRTGMLRFRAQELGVPVEKMGDHGYVIPKTRPLPPFNPADYDVLSGLEKLDRAEGILFLRDKYAQFTGKQLRLLALTEKARKLGVSPTELKKPLSSEEQELLKVITEKIKPKTP